MSEWGNFVSAEIDDGSLDGRTPQEIFMAGVQWGIAEALASGSGDFAITTYAWNADRVLSMLRGMGARYRCTPADDYVRIEVAR